MTHHKDCPLANLPDPLPAWYTYDACTCPVEPYTVEDFPRYAVCRDPDSRATGLVRDPTGSFVHIEDATTVLIRAEKAEAALVEAAMLARCMWRSVPLSESHRLSIASEALTYLRRHDLLTYEDHAFLAKQASK